MAGTKIGGLKAAQTNKAKWGDDFYKRIGSEGGKTERSTPRGFALNRELAVWAGRKGGLARKGTNDAMSYEVEHHETSAKGFINKLLRRDK